MKRRDFCKGLAVTFAAGTLAPAAALPQAGAATALVGRAVPDDYYTLWYRSDRCGADLRHDYYYSDSLFDHPATEYDNQLALATLGMAAAADCTWESDQRYWMEGEVGRADHIRDAFAKLGFTEVQLFNYTHSLNDTPDTVGCAIARKTLVRGGRQVTIIGAFLRGSGYGAEWSGNLHAGPGSAHVGFVTAARQLVEKIRGYVQTSAKRQPLGTLKLWMGGYSRATPKGSQSQDPFWDTAASMLLLALVFYLKYEAPPDEQNFPMVMELLRAGEVREDDDSYVSPLDELFDRLEMVNPEHIALKYYRDYHSGSAKTLKSIQITLAARLEKFNLESLAGLTATDELNLPSLGEKKVALFALIPDNDTSFNFLVSILYTQLFQQLFYLADHKYGGSLPVHCHFIMDEFANVSLPDDFDKILSVMRSRGVSVSIILQNLAQLKALFEKQWESIVGNCDEFLYLGGNEQSTHKYVSELLGKDTIDTNTYGKSSGRSGNYSTNYQISGRELMTPDEVRMLDNRYALLFVRGERPVMDFKYDILKHPNVKLTADGGQPPYIHGEPTQAVATLVFDSDIPDNAVSVKAVSTSYELLSDEDLEEIFNL